MRYHRRSRASLRRYNWPRPKPERCRDKRSPRPDRGGNALEDFNNAPSRYELARTWASYEDDSRHYIHLSDGGLSDNIGLRGPEVAITSSDSSWSLLNKVNNGIVKRLAVIVVDAKPQEPMSIDKSSTPP